MHDRQQIDYDSDEPPYLQLAAILRDQIKRGKLAPRRQLPSLVQLQQEYGLARGTVRKAIDVLVSEGLVRVRPGWGTFVAPPQQ